MVKPSVPQHASALPVVAPPPFPTFSRGPAPFVRSTPLDPELLRPDSPPSAAALAELARAEAEASRTVRAAAAAESAAEAAVAAEGTVGQAAAAGAKTAPTGSEQEAALRRQQAQHAPTYRPLQVKPNTNVRLAWYAEKAMSLMVEFWRDQRVYRYSQISVDVIEAMERAPDTGVFFYHEIRTAFPYDEVR